MLVRDRRIIKMLRLPPLPLQHDDDIEVHSISRGHDSAMMIMRKIMPKAFNRRYRIEGRFM